MHKKANQSSSAASGLQPDADRGRFVFVRRCLRTKMRLCGLVKCREIRGQPVTWEEESAKYSILLEELPEANGRCCRVEWGFGRRQESWCVAPIGQSDGETMDEWD